MSSSNRPLSGLSLTWLVILQQAPDRPSGFRPPRELTCHSLEFRARLKGPDRVPVQSSGAQSFAFRSRLVGELRMMSAIRQTRDRAPAAVPELGGGRIAQGPAARRLTQLHDRHPLRLRYDRFFSARQLCCFSGRSVGHHWCGMRVVLWGRLDSGGLVRGVGRFALTRRACSLALALSKTKAIRFAEHCVSAHALAQLCRDLAGAQALSPELFQALNPLLGPGQARICHRRLQAESFSHTDRDWPARVIVGSY